jgi:hypothetical protein
MPLEVFQANDAIFSSKKFLYYTSTRLLKKQSVDMKYLKGLVLLNLYKIPTLNLPLPALNKIITWRGGEDGRR